EAELGHRAEIDVVGDAVAAAVHEREPRVDGRLEHVLVERVVEAGEARALQRLVGDHGQADAPDVEPARAAGVLRRLPAVAPRSPAGGGAGAPGGRRPARGGGGGGRRRGPRGRAPGGGGARLPAWRAPLKIPPLRRETPSQPARARWVPPPAFATSRAESGARGRRAPSPRAQPAAPPGSSG